MPSSAPRGGAAARRPPRPRRLSRGASLGALVRLDPLPLAVHVRRGPRLGVAEHVRMAAHDLRRDRRLDVGQVEDPGLGRQLGVEHDLEQEVTELAGQRRRRARLERVVDLVRLLEQVLAQRRVGLLLVPRAAAGRAQAGADRRHRPRTGHGRLEGNGAEVQRRGEVLLARARRRVSAVAVPNRPTAWSAG